MKRAEMQQLIEQYLDRYNAFDVPGMLKVLDDAIRFQHVADGVIITSAEGLDSFRRLAEHSQTLFTQRTQSIKSITFSSNTATARIRFEAVAAVDFQDGIETGQSLLVDGTTEFVFDGHRIVSITDKVP